MLLVTWETQAIVTFGHVHFSDESRYEVDVHTRSFRLIAQLKLVVQMFTIFSLFLFFFSFYFFIFLYALHYLSMAYDGFMISFFPFLFLARRTSPERNKFSQSP